jgi:hypothetical protein
MWVIPRKIGALFVAQMENVLDLYGWPYDPKRPQVCIDEKGKELLLEIVPEEPMAPNKPRKADYEYKPNGACNLFMLYEPHTGYRHVEVTRQKRAGDFALFLKWIVDEAYPQAELIRVVCDNLAIHSWSCLYQAFAPEEARRLASKLEFHYTPTHASWLNMVEIEIGILSRQCLKRRMGEIEFVESEVAAWEAERNAQRTKIEWQFTCEKARVRLEHLYPVLAVEDEGENEGENEEKQIA